MRRPVVLLPIVGFAIAATSVASALRSEPPSASLTGVVSSVAEGAMEGVLIGARRTGSTKSLTVVSDVAGRYRFPAGSLPAGRYAIAIRAAGYDLSGAGSVAVNAGKPASADLRLVPAHDLASQLSDAEWLRSMPGSFDQKRDLTDCNSCHSLERIARSEYTADEFQTVIIPRMLLYYVNNSSPEHPQHRPNAIVPTPTAKQLAMSRPLAEYLARINLSGGRKTWDYALKTAPRPKGAETRVLINEWDLPRRDIAPHDVVVTKDNRVFYSSFFEQRLGELNPTTGAVTEYPTPLLKPGSPTGSLDLEYDPRSGDLWLGMMFQGAIARFDPKTRTLRTWSVPAEFQNDTTQQAFVTVPSAKDGKMWVKDSARRAIYRFDPTTGKFESFGPITAPDGHEIFNYGIYADTENGVYGLDFPGFVYGADRSNFISHVDPATGALSTYAVPTHQSRPRRGSFDAQDRLWFAEYDGNRIGMFDARTKLIQEWLMPDPFTFPYDAMLGSDGKVWTGSMFTDRVIRLDPKDGSTISFLLPRPTNIRRVFVDNSTPRPSLWVGSNHGGSIVQVLPLD